MRRRVSLGTSALTAVMAAAVLSMFCATSFAATPTLGQDCGGGATIVGSNAAGKVTLGAEPTTCTLTFTTPYANPPACGGTNETNGGSNSPVPIADKTTTTTVVLNAYTPWTAGDVISYLCVSY